MLIARSVHPLPGEAEREERLLGLVDGFSGRRVLVIGDLIADEFIYGEVARVSREAPVLILKYDATEMSPAAPATPRTTWPRSAAARARRAWSARRRGRRLLAELPSRRRPLAGRSRAAAYRTPVKTRILAGGIHSAKQQVVRIDRETGWPLDEAVSRAVRGAG